MFEQILEQQREQTSRQLQTLIPVIILVVHGTLPQLDHDQSPDNMTNVNALGAIIKVHHGNMTQNHIGKDIPRLILHALLPRIPKRPPHGQRALGPHLIPNILERLSLRRNPQSGGLLQTQRQGIHDLRLRPHALHEFQIALDSHGLHGDANRHVVGQGIVFEEQPAILDENVGFRLSLPGRTGNRRRNAPRLGILFDDDPILGHLLLNQNNLLHSLDDEIPTGIVGTFLHLRQFPLGLAPQKALGRSQHDGHPSDHDFFLDDDLTSAGVSHVDVDGGGVGAVSEAALEGRGLGGGVGVFVDGGFAHPAVGVAEVEFGVVVGADLAGGGGLHDLLHLHPHEMIEGIDMLLHQPPQLQKMRQHPPLLFQTPDRRIQRRSRRAVFASVRGGVSVVVSVGVVFHHGPGEERPSLGQFGVQGPFFFRLHVRGGRAGRLVLFFLAGRRVLPRRRRPLAVLAPVPSSSRARPVHRGLVPPHGNAIHPANVLVAQHVVEPLAGVVVPPRGVGAEVVPSAERGGVSRRTVAVVGVVVGGEEVGGVQEMARGRGADVARQGGGTGGGAAGVRRRGAEGGEAARRVGHFGRLGREGFGGGITGDDDDAVGSVDDGGVLEGFLLGNRR
mmetsp:Transcript_18341/g.37543  ORF Transcript_18341/g.37543 Transcript_18341/m.37543 type:complete len:617 (-) Transcript_18341:125-1975(-)